MVKLALTLLSVLAFGCVVFGSDPPTQAERERKVKVALALADARPAKLEMAPMPRLVKPSAAVKLAWFDDAKPATEAVAVAKTCPCGRDCKCPEGTCPDCKAPDQSQGKPTPAAGQVVYRLEQKCGRDVFGRQVCWQEWVPVAQK